MWVLQITWRSAGALPAPRIQSYKHTAPPELGQVSQVNYVARIRTPSTKSHEINTKQNIPQFELVLRHWIHINGLTTLASTRQAQILDDHNLQSTSHLLFYPVDETIGHAD